MSRSKIPQIPGTQYKIFDFPFFPWTFRSGLFIPELFSQQRRKLINAQITSKRPASSLMLTEFLIFFLLKFVFQKLSIVSPEFLGIPLNVAALGVNEIEVLPKAVEAVMGVVDVPLCIDINNPAALKETLRIYEGKAIVNSVSGEEKSLNEVLPLIKEYGTAVTGLTIDDKGIPKTVGKRLEIAHKIVERAEAVGIPRADIIIDCLALSLGSDDQAGLATLEAIQRVKTELGVNQTLGASNISFGLPDRALVNKSFLALAIGAGVTCPTVDAAKVRSTIAAIDLILGRDRFSQRFIKEYRRRQAEFGE